MLKAIDLLKLELTTPYLEADQSTSTYSIRDLQGQEYGPVFFRNGSEGSFICYQSNANAIIDSILIGIEINDSRFFNFTQLLYTPDQVLFVELNRNSNNPYLVSDKNWLDRKNGSFNYRLETSTKGELKSASLVDVFGQKEAIALPSKKADTLTVNMFGKQLGAYQLELKWAHDHLNYPFFFAGPSFKSYQMAVFWENDGSGKNWKVELPASKAIWRYFIRGISQTIWKGLEINPITTSRGTVSFEKSQQEQPMPNGEFAYLFYSNAPILWEANKSWKIQLCSKKLKLERVLPYATPDLIRRIKHPSTGVTDYYADVYIQF